MNCHFQDGHNIRLSNTSYLHLHVVLIAYIVWQIMKLNLQTSDIMKSPMLSYNTPRFISLAGGLTADGDNKADAAVRMSRHTRCKLHGDWYRQNQSLLCKVMSSLVVRIIRFIFFIFLFLFMPHIALSLSLSPHANYHVCTRSRLLLLPLLLLLLLLLLPIVVQGSVQRRIVAHWRSGQEE